MSNWIPYPFFHDQVPIDISFVFADEKPAGKHGFLQARGREFIFEDGTRVKFWGTNFNGCGCFPEKPYAEKLAKRLAAIGLNLVRFHQLDSQWHTPNIFSFTKGQRSSGGSFDPESMDRLDYLIHCLKKEGIYCYMDMFTYRKFRSDEGVANAQALPDAAKPYCLFDDRLIQLQKDLCRRLWTHVNPYTGLAYCDDPVFVMAEIVNESDLFVKNHPITAEPYRTRLLEKLDLWLRAHGYAQSAAGFDLSDYENEILIDFKTDLQERYYAEMLACMRECGVKIPITGNNWTSSPANLKTQLMTDYYDNHPYFYDWRWGEFEKHCMNTAITQQRKSFLNGVACSTNANMPTFISEWDMPWPNEFRAESPIYCAAVGLLQGWSGYTIHTYSYSTKLERMNMLGKEISAEKIGNVPYRQGIFSTWNDPAKFGLFYHAALMTRRGDVAPAKGVRKIKPLSKTEHNITAVTADLERTAVIADYSLESFDQPQVLADACEVRSDTGQLYRSWEKNYGYVDTPMTKCAYGFLEKNGTIRLSGMTVDCRTDFAVIAASSLTNKDLQHTDNILLTAVGRAKNTDCRFEGEKMLDIGKPPVLIEAIEAEISIETEISDLVVWAISAEGYYIGTVPAKYENGKLTFTIGSQSKSMYYLIVKE